MKSQILFGIDNLKYTDAKIPAPGNDQALIRVTRCGICGSDIPRIFRTGAHNMPLIPGHEMAGAVEECASRPGLVGKRVGVFPLIPCGKCRQCSSRHYEMCENYNYLGSRCDGGFAEYVVAPVWNLLPIPDEVSDDDAAMLEPMGVAVHAIRGTLGTVLVVPSDPDRLTGDENSQKGTKRTVPNVPSIVVCGLGTIGLLVAFFLRDAGYRNVFCIGNKDVQREKLLEMGYEPEQFIDVRNADPVAAIKDKTDGHGADYYFECIGRSESYEQAVKCAAPLGHIMLVGNPASDMTLPREVYWKILRNQLTLKGTWNSAFYGFDAHLDRPGSGKSDASDMPEKDAESAVDDWAYVLDRLSILSRKKAAGESVMLPSDLITHRFSLDKMMQGLEIMRTKSEEYVKVMVEC